MQFTATCSAGLEGLIQAEVSAWGGLHCQVGKGIVQWSGSLESGYRVCLWSRYASRVLLTLAEQPVASGDELYEFGRLQRWEDHLGSSSSFAVDANCAKDGPITHSHYASLRVKDAIVDCFREKCGVRPDVVLKRPDVRFNIHVGPQSTILSLDLSGDGLHRRGYRMSGGTAPLRETLAAALVSMSGWNGDTPLLDPMCGSGTILIEAALMAGDAAPGLGRTYYGFTSWRGHLEPVWQLLVEEALEREQDGLKRDWPALNGFDADSEVIGFARENIRRAGLSDKIQVGRKELLSLRGGGVTGHIVCNPPYGERLAEQDAVRYLYRCLGNRLQEYFQDWKIGLFTSQTEYADLLKIPWQQTYRLYNGPLACRLHTGRVAHPSTIEPWCMQLRDPGENGSDFTNRIRKNFKQLQRWLQKGAINSFRLYDRDLQEYNVTVELYDKYVFVREYPSSSRIDDDVARERFNRVLYGVRSLFGVGRDRVFARKSGSRVRRQKPDSKKKQKLLEIKEGRGSYLLDFSGSADVGLNLLQRTARQRVQAEASDKHVLNLFGRSGSMSVAAAYGDAADTTTVEPLYYYVAWARKNFFVNGMHEDRHQLVHSDCLEWLREQKKQYDLVFADLSDITPGSPGARFDPDQLTELITLVMALLHPHGTFYFTSSHIPLTPAAEVDQLYECRDITHQILPKDFAKERGRFHCWSVRHRPEDSAKQQ